LRPRSWRCAARVPRTVDAPTAHRVAAARHHLLRGVAAGGPRPGLRRPSSVQSVPDAGELVLRRVIPLVLGPYLHRPHRTAVLSGVDPPGRERERTTSRRFCWLGG